jgi:hypothetical protein
MAGPKENLDFSRANTALIRWEPENLQSDCGTTAAKSSRDAAAGNPSARRAHLQVPQRALALA